MRARVELRRRLEAVGTEMEHRSRNARQKSEWFQVSVMVVVSGVRSV